MQNVLRSCLRWLALYAVIGALLAALVYLRFPVLPAALGVGFGSGILVWFGVAYILGTGARGSEKRLIRAAKEGGRPADGEKVAVCGIVRGSGETLTSPITKTRCLAYEYKVLPEGREQAGIFDGVALAPMTIDGPRGPVRILAAPEFDWPPERLTAHEHYRNLREYIATTQWTVHEGIDVKREISHLKKVLADDDGRIRSDIRREKLEHDVMGMTLREQCVAPGEKVCAIGWYSATRGGLVPHGDAILHSVKLMKGEPDEILRRLGGKNRFEGLLGCGCLLPVLVAAIVALAVVPLDAIEQMLPHKDPSWTEVRAERLIEKHVRSRFPSLRPAGEIVIQLEPGQARGRLNETPLTRAAAQRNGDIVEIALAGDGDPLVRIRFRAERVEAAEVIGRGAIPAQEIEVERYRDSGEDVIGRITYLSTDVNLRAAFRSTTSSP